MLRVLYWNVGEFKQLNQSMFPLIRPKSRKNRIIELPIAEVISIQKEAKFINSKHLQFKFTSSCRNALTQILKSEASPQPRSILLPAYVGLSLDEGSGILDPVIESGFNFHFYKIDYEMNPVLSDLVEKINLFPESIVLFVNYFGWKIKNRDQLLEVCKSYELKVIEDNAHNLGDLYLDRKTDHDSDYQIYSIHKFLAIKSGGAVTSKAPLKYISNTISKNELLEFAMTPLEKTLETRMSNFIQLRDFHEQLTQKKYEIMFNSLPNTALNFPILMESKTQRQSLYQELSEKNIYPTALYHRLVPEITKEEFPISHEISNRILNLPVHQDIRKNAMQKLFEILNEFS